MDDSPSRPELKPRAPRKRGEPDTPAVPAGRVTIRDLADELGLSHATVSRALADHPRISRDTKERVRNLALQQGYVPNAAARNMRRTHSPLVGLIVPDIQNAFYAQMAKILADAAAAHGHQLVLSVTEDHPDREMQDVRALIEARAVGIIITPTASPARQTLSWLRSVRTVQFVRHHPSIDSDAVLVDDVAGLRAATTHLIHYGHRRIAYIGVDTDISCGNDRLGGFMAAMREHGLDTAHVALGPPRPEFARHAVHRYLNESGMPTALVMGSSSFTEGALMALRDLGRPWPDAMSVVCYGDAAWFDLIGPGLTTLGLPVAEMGGYVTRLLLGAGVLSAGGAPVARRRTGGSAPPTVMRFSPQLLVRGSTRPHA